MAQAWFCFSLPNTSQCYTSRIFVVEQKTIFSSVGKTKKWSSWLCLVWCRCTQEVTKQCLYTCISLSLSSVSHSERTFLKPGEKFIPIENSSMTMPPQVVLIIITFRALTGKKDFAISRLDFQSASCCYNLADWGVPSLLYV